jgi:putative (di)nucleoside polyphosphate hydrolase
MKNRKELPLRIGVGIALLNHENKIFVGKRIDNPANSWQMPQGGVDKNEDFLQAAKRELEEETSIKTVKVIKKLNEWLTYEQTKNLLGKLWKGKYRGQKQKWFIMKFLGKNDEINIRTKKAEFLDWKWIRPSDLPEVAVNFKVNIYKKIAKELALTKLN